MKGAICALLLFPSLSFAADERTRRTELNLQGQTDAASGESRRNENVQFNPIDNNALKDLNVRLGVTATLVNEFQAERNYFGAEFGSSPSAPLHLPASKRSGIHGGVYEWHSNSFFSARSFFQVGGVKPARTNDYGFQFGAAPWRGAFLSLEGSQQKARGSVNGNVLVPRADERTPLATDPATRRIVERFLAAYPRELPNRTDINERALNTNSPQSIDTNNSVLRLDQQAGRNRLTLQHRFTGQPVRAFQLVAGQNPNSDTKSHAATVTLSRAHSAATVLDVSLGFDRIHTLIVPEENSVGPQVSFGSLMEMLGPASTIPIDRAQNQFRSAVHIAYRPAGSHNWKFGAELLRRQINGSEYSSQRGTFRFVNDFGRDAITNFRLGVPSRFSVGVGDPYRGFRSTDMQFYAGDTWRASSNLTLHYGLRYEPAARPTEANGLSKIPYGCQCANLAPRFGFAGRLPAWWGTLRGAWGLHYGQIFPVTYQQLRFNPPGVVKAEIQNPSLVDPLAGVELNPDSRSTIFVLPENLGAPFAQQYNFSWEPALSSKWSLQLGYVGSRAQRLLFLVYNNRARPVPGIPQTNATVALRRPDPNRYDVREVTNSSRGYFDAARAAFSLRRWHGLTADAAYWFSKALDLGGDYASPAVTDSRNQVRSQSEFLVREDLRGPGTFHQPHAFLARMTYDIPRRTPLRGWSFSAVVLLKNGTPFDVLSGSDAPGFGNVDGQEGDRPNLADPSILGRAFGNPDTSRSLLPRSAFAFIQPTDLRGNLGRNVFRKGPIQNVNAALSRSWAVGKDKLIAFRAESINFLNTPQFAQPWGELSSPSFGQITNTLNDGRTFRLLLRLTF
ncbi:MAG: hypothetical protein HY822_11675 [Acidobacteria bacterium]|nr:hypothetical protein [Acidobacteriota bacterium]